MKEKDAVCEQVKFGSVPRCHQCPCFTHGVVGVNDAVAAKQIRASADEPYKISIV